MLQISPYIDDLATSNLLKDISKYAPIGNIPEFVSQQKVSTVIHQKTGAIGLFYFGCFVALFLFGIVFQKGFDEYLLTLGLPQANFFSNFIIVSLFVGLFINTMRLIGYNSEIAKLQENEISHTTRAYYLSPITIVVISFFASIVVWTFSKTPSEFEIVIMFIIGAVSLPISSSIERLFFRDNAH